jgi:hypothetical protein
MGKRSGGWARVALTTRSRSAPADVAARPGRALSELASFVAEEPVVELKFFGGLSLDDSAQALGLSRDGRARLAGRAQLAVRRLQAFSRHAA